jgi:hypothetical protein
MKAKSITMLIALAGGGLILAGCASTYDNGGGNPTNAATPPNAINAPSSSMSAPSAPPSPDTMDHPSPSQGAAAPMTPP